MPEPLLVLWDIDQTLVDVSATTFPAYGAAFRTTTGVTMAEPWRYDGRTELASAVEVMRLHGIEPDDALVRLFMDNLIDEFHARRDALTDGGRALPGAAEALAATAALPGVRQSVLTGNLMPVAVMKTEVFGLDTHLDFRIGAYGDDGHERTELPAYAFARTERHLGYRHGGHDTVIVGDTRRDIATARAAGARAVGIATGRTSAADLREAGAHVVLTDLTDTAAVLAALGRAVS